MGRVMALIALGMAVWQGKNHSKIKMLATPATPILQCCRAGQLSYLMQAGEWTAEVPDYSDN